GNSEFWISNSFFWRGKVALSQGTNSSLTFRVQTTHEQPYSVCCAENLIVAKMNASSQSHGFTAIAQFTTTVIGKEVDSATGALRRKRCPEASTSYSHSETEKLRPRTPAPMRKSAAGLPASKVLPIFTGTAISL